MKARPPPVRRDNQDVRVLIQIVALHAHSPVFPELMHRRRRRAARQAARAVGIRLIMVQAQGILVGGMLSGFAGAILSVDYTQTGGNEMTKRRPRRAGLLPRPPLQPPHRAQRRPLAPTCAAVRHQNRGLDQRPHEAVCHRSYRNFERDQTAAADGAPWRRCAVSGRSRSALSARARGSISGREPEDSGPPVGYWALMRDPDGHTLEVAYGQELGHAVEDAGWPLPVTCPLRSIQPSSSPAPPS